MLNVVSRQGRENRKHDERLLQTTGVATATTATHDSATPALGVDQEK